MEPKEGYWRRQFHLFSSIGIFYVIIFALFGIPLLGAFVVVLIKGAMDMRYAIITVGCIIVGLGLWLMFKAGKRLFARIRKNSVMAGEQVREGLLLGQPMEISVLNGVVKFSCGPKPDLPLPAISAVSRPLLPDAATPPDTVVDIVDHLDRIAALHRSGVISEAEFSVLKSRLMASASLFPDTSDPQHDYDTV